MKQSQFIDLKLQFTSMFKMSYHDVMKFLTIIKFFSLGNILLQSMIWQDRNLKFGSQIMIWRWIIWREKKIKIIQLQIIIWAKF